MDWHSAQRLSVAVIYVLSVAVFCRTAKLLSPTLAVRDFKAHDDWMIGKAAVTAWLNFWWAIGRCNVGGRLFCHAIECPFVEYVYVVSDCPGSCVEGFCALNRCSLQASIPREAWAELVFSDFALILRLV